MEEHLDEYRKKRDFKVTPEPEGAKEALSGPVEGAPGSGLLRFVVQEHHASSLHWDFRLEREGVLVSWAIPKGVPIHPKENRLAVRVEDHPLSYIDFSGEIPEGQYGAGKVYLWDRGVYESHKFRDDEVMITLRGERISGKYVLFRTRGKNWMIHRMDPPQDPARRPMPEHVAPMLAKPARRLPADDAAYAFEIKWDGIRAILYCDGGRIRIESRNLIDITRRFPELAGIGRTLGAAKAVLDGEIVALDERGRPSFQRLQARMGLSSESAVRRRAGEVPVTYTVFDLLYLEGHSAAGLPYTERRRLLEGLGLKGPYWHTPSYQAGGGAAMLEASRTLGLEGVIAKRLDSLYEAGRRSGAWQKIRSRHRQEFVIGGWTLGEGARTGRIGSLLVGHYDLLPEEVADKGRGQRLLYAGSVGTGFSESDLSQIGKLLAPLRRETSPFDVALPRRDGIFVEPQLICEVEFAEWTRDGTLRQPSFKGLRADKNPREVVRELTRVAGPLG